MYKMRKLIVTCQTMVENVMDSFPPTIKPILSIVAYIAEEVIVALIAKLFK